MPKITTQNKLEKGFQIKDSNGATHLFTYIVNGHGIFVYEKEVDARQVFDAKKEAKECGLDVVIASKKGFSQDALVKASLHQVKYTTIEQVEGYAALKNQKVTPELILYCAEAQYVLGTLQGMKDKIGF